MGDFLSITWDADDPVAGEQANAVRGRISTLGGWSLAYRAPDILVWVGGETPPEVRELGSCTIVGRCLARGQTCGFQGSARGPPIDTARLLCGESWGSYVAFIAAVGARGVFRDPSGGLECFTWMLDRLRVFTSDAKAPAPGLLSPRAALNWDCIAGWLLDPGSASFISGLDGVEIVAPGGLLESDGEAARQTTIWRPSDIAARGHAMSSDIGAGLVDAVGTAVEGLSRPHERILVELSGGLNSAIVAAALVDRGLGSRVDACLNYFGDRPEGDERRYAAAIAGRLGLPLECVAKPVAPLAAADFATVSRGLRPAFAAVDPTRDRHTAAALAERRATALLTGQGGDVVFFQMPTPMIAVDRVRQAGRSSLFQGLVGDVARFTRQPAWSILAMTLRGSGPPAPFRRPGLAPAAFARRASPIDPWAGGLSRLPPAKRLQAMALSQQQLLLGASRRRSAATLLCPLLSQPVVEFCLALSTYDLTQGRRDRALAREAFRSRLPATVADRHSKGDLTAHYGRVIAASLDVLRPLLLDGCLCESGLLDRVKLDQVLAPEALILQPYNGEILIAAMVESWVRWWQTRGPDSALAPRPRP